jgi:DNA repair protein RadC
MAAGPAALTRALEGNVAAVALLGAVRAVMLRSLEREAFGGPVLSTSQQLIDYLRVDMAHAPVERFRVLFLNAGNRLLCETVAEGCINQAPVYPREVMRRALDVGATALILAHNHPSGDPYPSRTDIEATIQLVEAARMLDICVHDHVIVSRSGWTSFKSLGLL